MKLNVASLPSNSIRAIIFSSHSGLPLFSIHSPFTEKIDTVLFSGLMTAIQDHLNEYSSSTIDDMSMITKGEFIFLTLNYEQFYLTAILDIDNPLNKFESLYLLARIFHYKYGELIKRDDPLIYQVDTFADFKYVTLLIMTYPNLSETSIPSRINIPLIPKISITPEELELLKLFDGEFTFKQICKITNQSFEKLLFTFGKLWYAGLAIVNYNVFVYDIYVITQKGIDALLYGSLSKLENEFLPYLNGHNTLFHIKNKLKLSHKKIEELITSLINREIIRPVSLQYSFLEAVNYLINQLLCIINDKYDYSKFYQQLNLLGEDTLSFVLKKNHNIKMIELSSSFRMLIEELYDNPINSLKYLTPLFVLIFSFITQQTTIQNAISSFNNALRETRKHYPNSLKTYDLRRYLKENQFI